jgi:hypothetical protein
MSADTKPADIPPDVIADAQIIAECVAAGKPIPSEVARRVREEAAKVTARLRRQYGRLDVGVPAIRELRGELPG